MIWDDASYHPNCRSTMDRWNRRVIKRLASDCNHSLRVKAKCRARDSKAKFASNQQWHKPSHVKVIRGRNKPQSLGIFHMAGDWDVDATVRRKHPMRVMLISNVDVENRFANGTQGRIFCWHPGSVGRRGGGMKALDADHPNLSVKFVKELSYKR